MPDLPAGPLMLATAGQLRRAGFHIVPDTTDNSATTDFDVVTSPAVEEPSLTEFETAKKRGDHMPGRGKP